jgi:hypothetical protein
MLADDVAAALPDLRAQAESLMVDTVFVEVLTDEVDTDPVTLEEVPVWAEVYAGRARIQRPGALSPREQVNGGFEFGIKSLIAQLPLSAVGIQRGMRVTVVGIGASTDLDLLDVVATVQANLSKTHPTKRTLVCQEVS